MTDADSASSSVTVTPGQRLRNARKEAGLGLREVADKLHLLPRQIEALEQDNYSLFNGDIFCKGYIRSYGKLLGLDTDELLASYAQLLPANMWPDEGLKMAAPQAQLQSSHRMTYIMSAAALIAVISLLWLSTPQAVESSLQLAEREVVIDGRDTSTLTSLQPQAEPTRIAEGFVAEPLADRSDEPSLVSSIAASEPARQVAESYAVAAASETEKSLVDTVDSLLTFQFSDECWVEVKDSDDRVLFANLKRAEDTLRLSGSAPFRILLGYAPAVSLDFNGEPVPIEINRKNNSARFVVGERL